MKDIKLRPLHWIGTHLSQKAEVISCNSFVVKYYAESDGYWGLISRGFSTDIGCAAERTIEAARKEAEQHYHDMILNLLNP
jgi:hypothetical protein